MRIRFRSMLRDIWFISAHEIMSLLRVEDVEITGIANAQLNQGFAKLI